MVSRCWSTVTVACAVLAVATGCGSSSGHSLRGSVTILILTPKGTHATYGSCAGTDNRARGSQAPGSANYSADLGRGARVTIADATGKIIASTRLGKGTYSFRGPAKDSSGHVTRAYGDCTFPFDIKVPDTTSYGVAVAQHNVVRVVRNQLTRHNWALYLSTVQGKLTVAAKGR
jgi:hypothetical protein